LREVQVFRISKITYAEKFIQTISLSAAATSVSLETQFSPSPVAQKSNPVHGCATAHSSVSRKNSVLSPITMIVSYDPAHKQI